MFSKPYRRHHCADGHTSGLYAASLGAARAQCLGDASCHGIFYTCTLPNQRKCEKTSMNVYSCRGPGVEPQDVAGQIVETKLSCPTADVCACEQWRCLSLFVHALMGSQPPQP